MKRILAIVILLICEGFAFGQATKSYLIADYNEKDLAFLQAKCRQASLDMSLSVLANRVATNSKHVSPKPSKHLLKQGTLQLQLPMNESQDEFAVYHSDIFEIPSTINVLLIDDELITYRTMETAGNIHLLYHCTRGAFGTKRAAHAKNTPVYKLWDTPERTLLPDLELQDQMAHSIAKQLSKTDCPLLVFNDLKSYAYNEFGDLGIGHFLDTVRKYNPDKMLQGDLLTPMSAQFLDRVNENQLWNASMRTKIIETLDEKQDFYRKRQMPWMIGNFQILLADKNRPATTYEELEWFLSKAAAYDAGFGLIFDAETMRKHGLTPTFLKAIRIWETLRMSGAFNEAQKEQFKDPYANWHIAKDNDSTYSLFAEHISRRYFCQFDDDHWEWYSPYASHYALCITVEGKGSISELNFRTPNGILYLPCSLKAGQHLVYDFNGSACVTDQNYNTITEVFPQGVSFLDEGTSEVTITCEVKPQDKQQPKVTVRYYTHNTPETLIFKPVP